MPTDFPRLVHFVAATLAGVAAAIHVGLGVWNWARWLTAGFLLPRDLRWPLFVVSGTVLAVGIVAGFQGWTNRRWLYGAGTLLLAGYVLAYFGWHLGGHRPLFLVGRGAAHEVEVVPFILDHLFAGPVEFVSVLTETLGAVVLGSLAVTESS